MPAAKKQYVVMHDVTVRVDEETGESKRFTPGDVYDGPERYVPELLKGVDFHGPLLAEKPTDAAPPATDKEN